MRSDERRLTETEMRDECQWSAESTPGWALSKTVLERHGMLGGMWTAGLLNPLLESRKGWRVEQLVDRLRQAGAWRDHASFPEFDTEMMKCVLELMFAEDARQIRSWRATKRRR